MTQESFENLLSLKSIVFQDEGIDTEPILHEARGIYARGECFTIKELAVNGDDLARAGIPPGKVMGDTLEYLLDAVMHDPGLNTKEKLYALL